MNVWDFCYFMGMVEETYFPEIVFIDTQFESGYHDRAEGFDFYNNSLPVFPTPKFTYGGWYN